jgi:hypothetical protein
MLITTPRKSLSTLAVLLVIVVCCGIISAQTVNICHATGTGIYVLINISENGANGHLANNGTPQAGHEMDFISTTGSCEGGPTPTPTPGAVPEPVTVLLFGIGIAGIGYLSRRYRNGRGAGTAG